MKRVKKPDDIKHPELQEFARQAVWTARLEDTMDMLADLCHDIVNSDYGEDVEPPDEVYDEEPMCIASAVLTTAYEDESCSLEARMIEWLAKDPEHWGIFNLIVVEPWQTAPGKWRRNVPPWVLALWTESTVAHYQHDPYGRQRVLDFDAFRE